MPREYSREINLYINGSRVKNDIRSIQAEMRKLVNEQARMTLGSKEYVAHGKKIQALRTIINKHNVDLKQTTRSWQGLTRAADAFNRYWQMGVTVVAGAVGMVMAFRKTAEAANEFEASLDNLSALTGLEGKELEWLGEKAKESSVSVLESGVRIRQSATDITEAYMKMGSQRPELLKDKEALEEVTRQAIILSEAGKIKLEPAVSALATTMNQFNARGSDAGLIINAIAAGSKLGAANIEYLSTAIEKSGTSAALLNMGIEETVALVEAVAPKFAQARVAGNSLDKVLLKMRNEQIGYKDGVFDMNRALDELRIRFKQGETAADMFVVEHAKMVEVLVQVQGSFNEFRKGVTGTNIALEQARKNTNNNATALEQARNKVQLMYIEIGQKLAPALVKSTNGWNYLLKGLMAAPEFLRKNQSLIILLGGAILAKNSALLKSIALMGREQALMLKSNIVRRATLLLRNTQAIAIRTQIALTGQVTMAQKRALVTTRSLNAAMKANPIGALIMGLTALVAALKYYETHNRRALDLEQRKQRAIEETTTANKALKESYDLIRQQIGSLNSLSIQEKKDLQEKIDKTIELAEAELFLAETKRQKLYDESREVKWYEHMLTWDRDKLVEIGKANADKAVAVFDEQIDELNDRLKSLKGQKTNLWEILNAESLGDAIGTETLVAMEEKLSKYTLALQNAKIGSVDYLRIQSKIQTLENQMAKTRGVQVEHIEQQTDQTSESMERMRAVTRELAQDIKDVEDDFDAVFSEQLSQLEESIQDIGNQDPLIMDHIRNFSDLMQMRKKLLLQNLEDGIISHREYYDKIRQLDDELARHRLQSFEDYAYVVTSVTDSIYNFYEARKRRELALYKDNDKKKEEIEKRYAKRQKLLASVQAAIEGIVEIARINSNAAVNADLSQTLRALLTAAAVTRTAANIAVIQAQQYQGGLYPVLGSNTGRTYQSTFLGPVKTGLYKKPTLGLFAEEEPEMVIDGPTTRNLMANFPEILSAIQNARVGQYSGGLYPSSMQSNGDPELKALIRQTIQVLNRVEESHREPALVSFRSFREAQKKYDRIQSRVNI